MTTKVVRRREQDRRLIALAEVYNLRDVGGYASSGGRLVRWGAVYRADGLHRAVGADRDRLRALGLRTVIDLRSWDEVAAGHVSVGTIGAERFHHLPVLHSLDETLTSAALTDAEEALAATYRTMLEEGALAIALALRVIADPSAHPVVFHCAAGKDRTGVLAAVLLAVLGVDDATIAEDYAMSAPAVERMVNHLIESSAAGSSDSPVIPAWLLSAPGGAIRRTLRELRQRHGSVEDYCLEAGVTEQTLRSLRQLLLEEAA